MDTTQAAIIVKTYGALVQTLGKARADRWYLGKGSPRYQRNLKLLQEAKKVLGKKI